MKTGREFIDDMAACRPGRDECGIWWMGQQSYVVKLGEAVLYLDPFLTPGRARRTPPLLRPEEVTNAALVLGSHDHGDHIDRKAWPVIAVASPEAAFVAPDLLRGRLAKELGIPSRRFAGLDDGTSFEARGVRITGVAAAHEFLDRDPATGRHPHLGYVIEANGVTLYHAGDCCIYEGLVTKLRRWRFDAVFLPINGRDARRLAANCIGNMTYQEAADLAGTLEPGMTFPGHYDMFAANSEDPQLFLDYMRVKYPRLRARVLPVGERFLLARA